MTKYENKEGKSLNVRGTGEYTELMQEVVSEAIKILENETCSTYCKIKKAVAFLKENFFNNDKTGAPYPPGSYREITCKKDCRDESNPNLKGDKGGEG